VQSLERSNNELIQYKKQFEEALNQIKKEDDEGKRLALLNLNILRRKSLMRMEQISTIALQENGNYMGQKQSKTSQFQPGAKSLALEAPTDLDSNLEGLLE